MKRSLPGLIPLIILTQLVACNLLANEGVTPAAEQSTATNLFVPISQTRTITETPAISTTRQSTLKATKTRAASAPTPTPSVTAATATPNVSCNRAAPGNPIDITIPDDTEFPPGEAFTKTWRLQNIGTCTWTKEYSAVWFSGERFTAPNAVNFGSPVYPGQTVDITIDMHAPDEPGNFQGNWKLRNANGTLFGIGPNGNSPFWVKISVVQVETPAPEPSPTPTIVPTQGIAVSGILNLITESSLDLDTLQGGDSAVGDLYYFRDESGLFHLVPKNNARIGSPIGRIPGYQSCQEDALAAESLELDSIPIGSYFCYQTKQGLPGWGRLVYFNPEDGMLAVEILTWSAP